MNERVIKYKGEMGALLEVFRQQEAQRLETAKDGLRKLLVYQASLEMNAKYDLQGLSETMDAVDVEADTALVWGIERIVGGLTRCDAFEFVALPVPDIADFCSNHQLPPPRASTPSPPHTPARAPARSYDRLFADLQTIVDSAWAGHPIEPADETLFRNIVQERDARRLFTTALHEHFPEKGRLQ